MKFYFIVLANFTCFYISNCIMLSFICVLSVITMIKSKVRLRKMDTGLTYEINENQMLDYSDSIDQT